MRQSLAGVVFWGFQLTFGGLFAAVFLFVVPLAVESWALQALSIALGLFAGLMVVLGFTVALWSWWSDPPADSEPATCPHCGQPLPPGHTANGGADAATG